MVTRFLASAFTVLREAMALDAPLLARARRAGGARRRLRRYEQRDLGHARDDRRVRSHGYLDDRRLPPRRQREVHRLPEGRGRHAPERRLLPPARRQRPTTGQTPTAPPPSGGGGGAFANPKTRAAFEKCRQYLPNGGQFGGGGGRPGVNSAAFAKYRQCLTAHGVKLTGGGAFGGANVASPAFQKAAKACRQYVPRFGGGSPPATTTP